MIFWQRVRHASFHNIVNRFTGTMMVLLGLLYSFPSESSMALSRDTGDVLSVRNLVIVFIACGVLLLIRHWHPFIASLLVIPALVLYMFNGYFLFRMLQQSIGSEFSLLIRPVWPLDPYIASIGLFWICKAYEHLRAVSKPR